jgi:hypothetical protein
VAALVFPKDAISELALFCGMVEKNFFISLIVVYIYWRRLVSGCEERDKIKMKVFL